MFSVEDADAVSDGEADMEREGSAQLEHGDLVVKKMDYGRESGKRNVDAMNSELRRNV